MPDYFDRNDTRAPKSRELALFRDLKTIVSVAKPRAAGLRRLLRGVDMSTINSRADLSRIPVLRRGELEQMRAEDPPFGGIVAVRPGALRRLMVGAAQGAARDWWAAGRAMAAAGFVKGDIVLNCFSYHLATGGHLVEGGAFSLGCSVIPAGNARVERKLEAIHVLKPTAYCGKPDGLKQFLDQARDMNCDVSSLRKALVFGEHLSPQLRADIEARGVSVSQAYVTADHGVIAYETRLPDGSRNEGMIVNEGLILEIVGPSSDEPLPAGQIGEVVVSRLNHDYPLLRLATGDLSKIMPGPSPCGRTNLRIKGWMGRANEATRIQDKILLPSDVIEISARRAGARRMQIRLGRDNGMDTLTLRVEAPIDNDELRDALKHDLREIAGIDGRIEILPPDMLRGDSRLIADERPRH